MRHLETKIRLFEDMLLRSRDVNEQCKLRSILFEMRSELFKMQIAALNR